MVALGAVLSGFFIVATNAWMQHPVGYRIVEGRAELTSLWALLTNPYARWQYPHVISGSLVVASMVVAGIEPTTSSRGSTKPRGAHSSGSA